MKNILECYNFSIFIHVNHVNFKNMRNEAKPVSWRDWLFWFTIRFAAVFTKQNEKRKWEKKGKIDQDVTVAYHKFFWMFFCLTIPLNKKITTFAYLES